MLKRFLASFFAAYSSVAIAQPGALPSDVIKTIEGVSGKTILPYSTRDFGREKYEGASSVLVAEDAAVELLAKIRARLPKGYVAFIGTTHSLAKPKPEGVELVVSKGNDQFDIIRIAATDGINYDILPEDIITTLKEWDHKYGIDIWQAESDSLQLHLKSSPQDLELFSKKVYEFCPDIVDQGSGDIIELQKEIKSTNAIQLWWD